MKRDNALENEQITSPCSTLFLNIDLYEESGSSPLEPITIEDKPPVIIDVRYVVQSPFKLILG